MSKSLKLLIPLVLIVVALGVLNFIPRRTADTYINSAQVYWHGDQALMCLTTKTVTRQQSWLMAGVGWVTSKVGMGLGSRGTVVSKPGSAHVYRWTGKTWDHQVIPAANAPNLMVMWPYGGKFYTWEGNSPVLVWNGSALQPADPERSAELRASFPKDPNNYLPAGKASKQPYSILQDVITRDEWHGYIGVTAMANGAKLPFTVSDNAFELQVQRAPGPKADVAADVTLTLKGPGGNLRLWPQ